MPEVYFPRWSSFVHDGSGSLDLKFDIDKGGVGITFFRFKVITNFKNL